MKKGKGFFAEFKKFILRGNVVDLAVGVIIGGAFQAIVKSLVDDIVMPLISLVANKDSFSDLVLPITIAGHSTLVTWGNFLSAVFNFLIMSFVIFCFIKIINTISEKASKKKAAEEEEEAPTTKKCPYCCTEIDIAAVKCPHCTSDIKED